MRRYCDVSKLEDERLVDGILILSKYDKAGTFGAGVGCIYYGDASITMSREDTDRLEYLGWFVEEKNDCWCLSNILTKEKK